MYLDGIDSICCSIGNLFNYESDEYMLKFVENIQAVAEEILITINLFLRKNYSKFVNMQLKLKSTSQYVMTLYRRCTKTIICNMKKIQLKLFNIKKFMKP